MEVVKADLSRLASCSSPVQLCPSAWVVAGALAAPHFLYAFIWFKPDLWQRLCCGAKAVDAFAFFGALGKGRSQCAGGWGSTWPLHRHEFPASPHVHVVGAKGQGW
jgi:hypothetical protein